MWFLLLTLTIAPCPNLRGMQEGSHAESLPEGARGRVSEGTPAKKGKRKKKKGLGEDITGNNPRVLQSCPFTPPDTSEDTL